MKYLILDFETFSECDLKKAGGYEYSKHPTTEIICAAFRSGTLEELAKAKTQLWLPAVPSHSFGVLLGGLLDPSVQLVAHNALFEQLIVKHVFAREMASKPYLAEIPIERWHCTAALSRSLGLPGKLEEVSDELNLKHQKDMEGHRLMLRLSKPKRPSMKDPSTRDRNPEKLTRLYEYCKRDVDAETELFLKLPPLAPIERKFWVLNQRMNLRGFKIDRELVQKTQALIEKETQNLDRRVNKITSGLLYSARQRDALLQFVRQRGVNLPDLRAQTVREALEKGIKDDRVRIVLGIRDLISRSSTAKYSAFEIRSRSDSRARDNTIFYGAHTGREAGVGLQPQNLFKSIFKHEELLLGIELIKAGDLESIQEFFDKPMELFASLLRSCIIADFGKCLYVGDLATIEVRVLFWLAGHQKGLDAIANGVDLYLEMAAHIYGEDLISLTKAYKAGDKEAFLRRQLGKQTILGAGFGIGVGGEKFQKTAKTYGMDIELELAQKAVRSYRERHKRIPIFWTNVERAAVQAVLNPGKRYRIGYLTWERKGDFLTCELPIGRKLHYFKPRVEKIMTAWGPKEQLSYRGVDPKIKKVLRQRTWGGKITENVVQAVARDIQMSAMLRLEENGFEPILSVHDEALGEAGKHRLLKEFLSTMGEVPTWAKGLPIKVEGWAEDRYRK